jgi:hypothetical protein
MIGTVVGLGLSSAGSRHRSRVVIRMGQVFLIALHDVSSLIGPHRAGCTTTVNVNA